MRNRKALFLDLKKKWIYLMWKGRCNGIRCLKAEFDGLKRVMEVWVRERKRGRKDSARAVAFGIK